MSDDGQTIWVAGNQAFGEHTNRRYAADDFSETGFDGGWDLTIPNRGILAVDPSNQYLLTIGESNDCDGGTSGFGLFEYHPSGEAVDCSSEFPVGTGLKEFAIAKSHRLYVPDGSGNRVVVYTVPKLDLPAVEGQRAREITANKAVIKSLIAPHLGKTTFHVVPGLAHVRQTLVPRHRSPNRSAQHWAAARKRRYPRPRTRYALLLPRCGHE